MDTNSDSKLWRQAKARMEFRVHFGIYLGVMLALWVLWAWIGVDTHPWPVYPTIGWGIGIFFHFLEAYQYFDRMTKQEYMKLKGGDDA
jgi:hypothetical protein